MCCRAPRPRVSAPVVQTLGATLRDLAASAHPGRAASGVTSFIAACHQMPPVIYHASGPKIPAPKKSVTSSHRAMIVLSHPAPQTSFATGAPSPRFARVRTRHAPPILPLHHPARCHVLWFPLAVWQPSFFSSLLSGVNFLFFFFFFLALCHQRHSCMWCDSQSTCMASDTYVTTFPFGDCLVWSTCNIIFRFSISFS